MKYATISADIISSTSLTAGDKDILSTKLNQLINDLANTYAVYTRVIKGDYLEGVISNPRMPYALHWPLKVT